MIETFEDFLKKDGLQKELATKYLTKKGYCDEIYLESMRDYFGDDLPDCVYGSIETGDYADHILESLKSHDINLLKKKLKEMFVKEHPSLSFVDSNDKGCAFWTISQTELDTDQLKNVLEFFGYYITQQHESDGEFYYAISPTYATDANDLVYVQNHGKLYHFSAGINSKEIERTGLRCKSATYRYFPKRIYAFASCKRLDGITDIIEKIEAVVDPMKAQRYGLYIYRIDLNKTGKMSSINFYTDDTMPDKDAVYTYNNIPAECITLVDVINFSKK